MANRIKTFYGNSDKPFLAYNMASDWCKAQGWGVGTMSWPEPTYVFTQEYLESKGANLSFVIPKACDLWPIDIANARATIASKGNDNYVHGNVILMLIGNKSSD